MKIKITSAFLQNIFPSFIKILSHIEVLLAHFASFEAYLFLSALPSIVGKKVLFTATNNYDCIGSDDIMYVKSYDICAKDV